MICFIRLYIGPDVPNRTVAFDVIAIHTVAIVALFAIRNHAPYLIDVTIITGVAGLNMGGCFACGLTAIMAC